MKPRLYSYVAILLASAVLVFSCKKGDTGPAGPAGPAGSAGAAGAAGPKGDTGTANVIYSAWTDVVFKVDTLHDLPDPTAIDTIDYSATITAPKITSDVLAKGQVTVYINVGSAASPVVFPLPYNDLAHGSALSISPLFALGQIVLISNAPNDYVGTYTQSGVKYQQYRYVIIPGGVPASVNTKNYNSIKNYFKLPD
ncbi:MAG: hypothetical protein JST42_05775 [Bacteroidetes bacterium]|nr:hypothetical protein [Bacteroidota bacterium]